MEASLETPSGAARPPPRGSCAKRSAASGFTGADFAKLSKEYSELSPIVDGIDALRRARDELASLTDLAQSS